MTELVAKHVRRLRGIFLAFTGSLAVLGGLADALPTAIRPALPQAQALLWGCAFLAAANLATVTPVFRAMMAGPRRAYAVGRHAERLLAAHLSAFLVALGRAEAVGVFGLALLFVTGRRDWFWVFYAAAAMGTVLQWPRPQEVRSLLAVPGQEPIGPTG